MGITCFKLVLSVFPPLPAPPIQSDCCKTSQEILRIHHCDWEAWSRR